MGWKDTLRNNMFLRNMAGDIFGRLEYSKAPGHFTPYFQYRIGPRQKDFYLYFPREPFPKRYYNEFFNKLSALMGADIYKYIEFHFGAYDNKQDFLRFMRYELSDRLKRKLSVRYRQKYQTAMEWVIEKQAERQAGEQTATKQEIEENVRELIGGQNYPAPADPESVVQSISEKIGFYLDKIVADTEEKLAAVSGSIPSGNIGLNNRNHEEKIIQLFLLLREVKAPPPIAKTEQLFKRFSDIDIATLLHLHFEAFRDKKIPTLQKTIGQLNSQMKPNNPRIRKLNDALQEFFY